MSEYFHKFYPCLKNPFNFLVLISTFSCFFLIFPKRLVFLKCFSQFYFVPLSSNLYLLPISPFKLQFHAEASALIPCNLHVYSSCSSRSQFSFSSLAYLNFFLWNLFLLNISVFRYFSVVRTSNIISQFPYPVHSILTLHLSMSAS